MSVCQSPQLNQDATATAVSGGGPLAAAAARGLSRAAMQCCSKVAEHLAGTGMSATSRVPAGIHRVLAQLAYAGANFLPWAMHQSYRGCPTQCSDTTHCNVNAHMLPHFPRHTGALLSLEAGSSFVSDLDAALKATGSSLPACALPPQLGG